MKQYPVFLLLAFLFISCAASVPYATDYPLTDQIFQSRDGMFSGKIPRGWFSSTDDSLGSALNALLIKEDFSATLTLKELKLDRTAAEQVRKQGLPLLARLGSLFRHDIALNGELKTTEFELKGKKFCSYEQSSRERAGRVIVFVSKGKYYECEVKPAKGQWSAEEMKRMFTMQQTVLASLRD